MLIFFKKKNYDYLMLIFDIEWIICKKKNIKNIVNN